MSCCGEFPQAEYALGACALGGQNMDENVHECFASHENQPRVYYKIVALERELRSYLQHLLKTINIKMYLVLHALCYDNCINIF